MIRRLAAFARLTRPTFLMGGFVGGALGTAVAAHRVPLDWRAYAVAQAAITGFHLMTHYANEYFDRHGDAASRTPFSGGSGVLVEGALPAKVALAAAIACFACGAVATAALALSGRPLAAALAAAVAALAWAYSAPPWRLSSRGLGEVDTAVVVAVLVPLCTYAAQAGRLDIAAIAVTLPGAAAMLAMMLCVEVPDRKADAACAKRTLVVRWGLDAARALGIGAVAVAWPAAVGSAVALGAPPAYAALQACALPPALGLARAVRRYAGPGGPADAELAGRGVAFFFLVSFNGVLAFLTR